MKAERGCACLIGTAVIDLEKTKRKTELRLKELDLKIKKAKDKGKIAKLKSEKDELMKSVLATSKDKRHMKKRFHNHMKKSGYAPPKFKGK